MNEKSNKLDLSNKSNRGKLNVANGAQYPGDVKDFVKENSPVAKEAKEEQEVIK